MTFCLAILTYKLVIVPFHHGKLSIIFLKPHWESVIFILVRVVTAWTFSNLVAGSDSTGTMMKTIWHNLLSHPTTATRLYQELSQNDVSRPFPKWREIATLPYLEACVNEAIRLEPAFGLPFERVVPLEGAIIGGRFLPGGTIIGMSPWVVNRHQPTFGEDSDQWRPDRWLVEGEPRRLMENSVLTVSALKLCIFCMHH